MFYHLSRAQGLSDNYIYDMCVDRNGLLWIATGGGLNMFNGKTITRFAKEQYPALKNDNSRQLVCDDKNRIWLLMAGGFVAVIDEYRQFHKVDVSAGTQPVTIKKILHSSLQGLILITAQQHYLLKPGTGIAAKDSLTASDFSSLKLSGKDQFSEQEFSQYEKFDDNKFLFVSDSITFLVNYLSRKVEKEYRLRNTTVLCRWDDKQILCCDKTGKKIFLLNLETAACNYAFENYTDQYGRAFSSIITNARPLAERKFLLMTVNEGIYILAENSATIHNYRHQLTNPYSITSNSTKAVAMDGKGWIFVSCTPNGISYFNYNGGVGQQFSFIDKAGRSYDGHINSVTSYNDDTYYIGVTNTLIRWKRSTNETEFLGTNMPTAGFLIDGIASTVFDSHYRNWSAVPRLGVFVRDTNNRFIKQLNYEAGSNSSITSSYVLSMAECKGYMWLGTRTGICRVNIENFEVDTLKDLPFTELRKDWCNTLWFADSNTLWIGTFAQGAWCYDFSKKTVRKYSTATGLTSNSVLCFGKDRNSNIYMGTDRGMAILLSDGQVKQITRNDGLINERVEALLADKKGRIWMCSGVGLSCYNTEDGTLRIFDERYGLSVQGFRGNSRWQNKDDEQLWGTERGLQFFYPDDLWKQKINLQAIISRIESKTVYSDLGLSRTFKLPPEDNYVHFFFSAIDYSQHLHTFYQYKLEGFDKGWITVTDQDFVRYNSLSPGKYTFRLRASNDKYNWTDAQNTVTIIIALPWWQSWWFKVAGILLAAGLFYSVIRYFRNKQKRKNEELESELVINYFASQINSRYKTDELLWDVAKNLIGKLGFENCMIYLWNEDKTVLVQRAGYGTKGSMPAIKNMGGYNIPKGKGIVGAAVESRQNLLVNDTSKDKRYFTADGKIMLSELCVPLIHGNETLGAINIEHRQKNFFTANDMQMLSTIAVLCANQVQRIKAEEEKQQAMLELVENKRRTMEFRLQSLRLQMNPHFLFNALNSVQQMILANEEMVATRYLSRFSKLLRTILVHSGNETIALKEEIEILNLYAELESTRFKGSFKYRITCDEDIDQEEIKIPTLLVQPFVENAIWHGLMHKEGSRFLKIDFTEHPDFIRCTVEDNGLGRQKSAEMKLNDGSRQNHKSRGIEVSVERLRTMKTVTGQEGSILFIDKKDAEGKPAGTIVQIDFPI